MDSNQKKSDKLGMPYGRKKKIGKSGFRGVYWREDKGLYQAYLYADGKGYHVGYYKDPIECAIVYDKKAIELLNDKAITNKKLGLI